MKQTIAASLVLACLATAACTTGMTEPKSSIGMTGQTTLNQVTAAIQEAGVETAWQMKVVRPGLIEASREWGGGKHSMVVEVIYDAKSYTIKYKDSKNLQYDGSSIHRTYWINTKRLDDAIKARTWKL